MAFEILNEREKEIVRQAMNFILHSGDIDEHDDHPRLGVTLGELAAVLGSFPDLDDSDEAAFLCINNCLNEVCNGIGIREDKWLKWFNADREEILAVYYRWADLKGLSRTGVW